jgi:HTH-type transcriptional regulator, transcriptional repressor of NAD biosynthesis genes
MNATHSDRLRRVTLFGAESAGKTTLANRLARHFHTVVAPEYGRTYTEMHGQDACSRQDMLKIAKGHLKLRRQAEREAQRILFEDTDPVLTAIWSDTLAGGRDKWFDRFDDYPDLYLLCDIDLPWVKDGVRYFGDPAERRKFQNACEAELIKRGVRYQTIGGAEEERLAAAIAAVDALLVARTK